MRKGGEEVIVDEAGRYFFSNHDNNRGAISVLGIVNAVNEDDVPMKGSPVF